MRGAARFALATALVALAVGGCSDGDDKAGERTAITGSFIGTVAGSDAYLAIVVGPKGDTLAYVTDGAYSVDWLDGTRRGDSARIGNEGGATLDATFRRGIVTGSFTRPGNEPLNVTARPGNAPAGLYRATADFPDGLYAAGWVVLPDGSMRGSVRRYETPLTPGEVDATTFKPGDPTFAVPGGVLRPELVRPSGSLSLPS
jgi:hypothetical protein